MNNSSRVIANTAAQYIRTIINLCLSLYSTRVILDALGLADYGIYTLVAGVVSLLSFVINALVVTTQRYLSFYSGQNSYHKIKDVFYNSVIIHVALACVAGVFFEIAGLFLFDGVFNIDSSRIYAAKIVFHIVTINVIISFITAPFRAILIAHENIVFISIIDVIDGILKLIIAFVILRSSYDKLILYAFLLCCIQLFNLLIFISYDTNKYKECVLFPIRSINWSIIKEMAGFAIWTIYSIFCVTGRTQGVAIILNKFGGVVINAAYGIGMQVNGAISFLSQSVANAINPQIMKAEGAGNRNKMLRLAEIESKICFLLLSMFLIPCVFEMPGLLELWLGRVPEKSVYFCRMILIATLIDQLTVGLIAANQSIGKIKTYSLVINSIKLLTIPACIAGIYIFPNIYAIMYFYILFELICAISRLFFLKKTAGLSIFGFFKRVIFKELIPVLILTLYCYLIISNYSFNYRFIFTICSAVVVYFISICLFGMCDDEKQIIKNLVLKFLGKKNRGQNKVSDTKGA